MKLFRVNALIERDMRKFFRSPALMDLARVRHVTVRKVSVTSTTLDDVFLHYTGSELRDAAHGGAGYDISHLYR